MLAKKVFKTMKTGRLLIRDFMFSMFLRIILIVGEVTQKRKEK
jgi:hypothetical protein